MRLVVNGLVQGVGFRYFAQRTARELGLTGLAQNLPGGEVCIIAEGEKDKLEEFLRVARHGPRSAHVRGVTVEWGSPTGEYSTFEIR
jgi:acylphosphatase